MPALNSVCLWKSQRSDTANKQSHIKAKLVTNKQIGIKAKSKAANEETFAQWMTNSSVDKVRASEADNKVHTNPTRNTGGTNAKERHGCVLLLSFKFYELGSAGDVQYQMKWEYESATQNKVYLYVLVYGFRSIVPLVVLHILCSCKKVSAPQRHVNWHRYLIECICAWAGFPLHQYRMTVLGNK